MQEKIRLAQEFLVKAQLPEGGWGYRADSPQAFPEPTCYSLLALADTSFENDQVLTWLSGLVNSEGQLYLPGDDSPNWGTSHLIIALSRLDKLRTMMQSSINWLLQWTSQYVESSDEVVTLDGRLIGWPWISNTFSWVLPTSYAVIALKLTGLKDHDRVKEAEALLFDRMCLQGGWNFGNPIILNRPIDPSLSDTAIALFALQDLLGAADAIDMGVRFLEQNLDCFPSAFSLALGIMCLSVFNHPVEQFVDLLLSRQEPDGSWRKKPWWTALSILALQVAEGGENVFKL